MPAIFLTFKKETFLTFEKEIAGKSFLNIDLFKVSTLCLKKEISTLSLKIYGRCLYNKKPYLKFCSIFRTYVRLGTRTRFCLNFLLKNLLLKNLLGI